MKKTTQIFTRLEELGVDVIVLGAMKIVIGGTPGSIVLCMQVNKIINTFNSTQEIENEVSELLSQLCKNHFGRK